MAVRRPAGALETAKGAVVDVATKDLTHSAVAKVEWKAEPFAMTDVRLLPSLWKETMELNRSYLYSLPNDRLAHNFRVTAGIASDADPLGGWEDPKCELPGTTSGITFRLAPCSMRARAMSSSARRRTSWLRCWPMPGEGRLPERVSHRGV